MKKSKAFVENTFHYIPGTSRSERPAAGKWRRRILLLLQRQGLQVPCLDLLLLLPLFRLRRRREQPPAAHELLPERRLLRRLPLGLDLRRHPAALLPPRGRRGGDGGSREAGSVR